VKTENPVSKFAFKWVNLLCRYTWDVTVDVTTRGIHLRVNGGALHVESI
jgi:hypothetical protein